MYYNNDMHGVIYNKMQLSLKHTGRVYWNKSHPGQIKSIVCVNFPDVRLPTVFTDTDSSNSNRIYEASVETVHLLYNVAR